MPASNDTPFTDAELAFLRELVRAHASFLVVGMGAAVLQGADAVTEDLDLWFRTLADPGLDRAARAAGGMFAWRMNPPMVAGKGLDRIDLVFHCHGLRSFNEEVAAAVDVKIEDFVIKVLPIERIIASKLAANRPKDRLAVEALRTAKTVLDNRTRRPPKPRRP